MRFSPLLRPAALFSHARWYGDPAMHADSAVALENVSKSYQLGIERAPTLKELALGFWRRRPEGTRHQVLRDVSFHIPRGQVLGIIGENGSGKSTILKLVAGVTDPDSGRVHVAGRVSSLLEVGAGFHPDMTGRENIYLNGAILGMSRSEVRAKFDSIVAFAELEEFIDTAVKYYSSGMYMRLGFSVGIHVEPEIMVVDEILSVGDEVFQLKCKEKMKELKRRGVTLIFVSHDLGSIQEICDRALLIDGGRILYDGAPPDTVAEYHALIFDRFGTKVVGPHLWAARNRFGTQKLRITDFYLVDAAGERRQALHPGDEADMVVEFECEEEHFAPLFSLSVQDDHDRLVFSTDMRYLKPVPERLGRKGEVRLRGQLNLLPGFYTVTLIAIPQSGYGASDWMDQIYDCHHMTFGFTVKRRPGEQDMQQGAAFLASHWEADWLEPYPDVYAERARP